MAITMTSGFNIKGKEVVDGRIVLTKEEMLNSKKTAMPEKYFCLCSDDNQIYVYDKSNELNSETGLFRKLSGTSGGSGNSTLEEDIIAGVSVGGINSDTKIQSGTSFTDLMKMIFTKYDEPTIKLISSSQINYVESGNSIDQISFDIEIVKGTNNINKVTITRDNNEIIYESMENVSDGCTINQTIENISVDTTITVEVDDNFTITKFDISYLFVNPYYYGTINNIDTIDVSQLNKIIQPKCEFELSFTSDNEYLVIMLDKNYGELKDINDGTFSNLSSFNKKEMSINSIDYLVYISEVPVTCNNFKYYIS